MFATKKQIAVFLSRLQGFTEPTARFEQYATESEVAAAVIWDARQRGDIEGKCIVDLGAGPGILGIGALALGAAHVVFVEIDERVLPVLRQNLSTLEKHLPGTSEKHAIVHASTHTYTSPADVIIMNPPFGTRARGADSAFVDRAIAIAPVVYSLHKASTLPYLRRLVRRCGGNIADEQPYALALKQTMTHHTRKISRIRVVRLRITRS